MPIPLVALALLTAVQAAPPPEQQVAAVVKTYLGMNTSTDWAGLEKLPGITWAPLPPRMLTACLPDGGCFTRQGQANVGGRSITVVATGARTIVSNLYLRNSAAPVGDEALLAALKPAGLTALLARCPVQAGVGGTSWYRITGAKLQPGYLAIQVVKGAKPSEGFTVTRGEDLPQLQPNQLTRYSEQCGAGAERKAVATSKPHEMLAQTVVALLAPASGPYDWTALKAAAPEVTWNTGPVKGAPTPGDPDPLWLSGSVAFAGRKFSVNAIGSATQVRSVTLEEQGMHPRGEHMLGVVYEKGIAVQLVRCGPVYTESTNNWYSLASTRTRPAMIRQSIRYEGNNVQDSYELRLDGSLPPRDSRDRNPGVADCR